MSDINNITVYLGSSGRCRDIYKESAKKLGDLIGSHGKSVVYGGMDAGLMGIVASQALESGAHVTGIIPKKLKDSERIHPGLNETILVPDLWERKLKMFKLADAIICLAGGFGTIDEMLEAIYWAQLSSHTKPIILVNTDNYWDEFIKYLNTLPDIPKDQLIIVNNMEDIFGKLKRWRTHRVSKNIEKLPHFEDDILSDSDQPIIINEASIKNSYLLATALGLKQLGKHNRHIGILNNKGQFDNLLSWVNHAQKEHFITDRCTELYSVASNQDELIAKLDKQKEINIDLDIEKWGPSETTTHIEVIETE